ncbi:MAG: DUF2976 domain-containing protein [Candidatus Thiodiazotropha lotti]|uniref:DUF2976 domain-containing protein n=1 Tax=Candidatus Thiodiazotropha lotti TaxID=2792787 RepID=A0A9E4K2H8_9GAMM|nr:DUF2976 domain-containing protein [Candidatus Thiodiazotropha lotti]MCW4202010.1 DUF2976 domain-containing protein [Candidatus Thiodiazotropha lotti]ODB95183.1 hypothetical protein A3197_17640 [Candidatus Thiodiazotropha endoloripes]
MTHVNKFINSMVGNPGSLFSVILMFALISLLFLAPEAMATQPALPDIGSGGADDLLEQSAGTTQQGMFYAIWVVGILLIFVPAYFLIGAFADWMKGRKELGEVGAVIIVGVVIVVAGMWLLSTASDLTNTGI